MPAFLLTVDVLGYLGSVLSCYWHETELVAALLRLLLQHAAHHVNMLQRILTSTTCTPSPVSAERAEIETLFVDLSWLPNVYIGCSLRRSHGRGNSSRVLYGLALNGRSMCKRHHITDRLFHEQIGRVQCIDMQVAVDLGAYGASAL
jgi:hypothetical protein